MLYANFMAVSPTEPDCPLNFLHCGNEEFCGIFAKNNGKYNISHLCCKIDADDAKAHFLAHCRLLQLVCCRSYTHCFTPNRLVRSLPVT